MDVVALSQLQFPGMPEPDPARLTEKQREPRGWSGPIPGQEVMGVHDLGDEGLWREDSTKGYHADEHGFIFEHYRAGEAPPADQRAVQIRPGVSVTLDRPAHRLYDNYGGAWANKMSEMYRPYAEKAGYSSPTEYARDQFGMLTKDNQEHDDKVRRVHHHWDKQPLAQVRADTPIHTGQPSEETEFGGAGRTDWEYYDEPKGLPPEGRRRIQSIQADLESGEEMHKPVWLARKGGRLFALDGHHRIVAAREAGQSHFPARVWDVDRGAVPQ